jgi:predicted metal-dependent hydrolase
VSERLLPIFHQAYRGLRPGAPVPELKIQFYSFANLNNTIRMREGRLYVRVSDLLQGAPEDVIEALAHILLAKMYRKPIERQFSLRYRRYTASRHIVEKAHLIRQIRGRKRMQTPEGRTYNLEEIFDDLNVRFFFGLLARPQMSWSPGHARNRLGHYDPAHNAIVISRIFDHPRVPQSVLEYVVYHEMLHLKHPVKLRGSRRCVHSAEFQAEENLFPEAAEAKRFLLHF